MDRNQVHVKVVLLGDSGVGKSSIVLRFVADNFKADADATIGASYMGKMMQYYDKSIKFNIWDTAGQQRYHTLAKMYYRDANAAIMVYDVTNPDSFQGLKRWNTELNQHGPKEIIKVIAGNKEDLIEQEAVSPDQVSEFAKQVGAVYKKTSAKTNYGVQQVFKEIAGKVCPEIDAEAPRNRRETINLKEKQNTSSKKKCC